MTFRQSTPPDNTGGTGTTMTHKGKRKRFGERSEGFPEYTRLCTGFHRMINAGLRRVSKKALALSIRRSRAVIGLNRCGAKICAKIWISSSRPRCRLETLLTLPCVSAFELCLTPRAFTSSVHVASKKTSSRYTWMRLYFGVCQRRRVWKKGSRRRVV